MPAANGIGTPIIIVKTKTSAITIGPLKKLHYKGKPFQPVFFHSQYTSKTL
jgi:hypothetical protein